ncbi:hypothetical protein ANN_25734 [Periplaneta americana]|uniref:DDE-1 domain-containing protein n=1 Tax=Periplaneta americana TaxID=6978 RepID=A0ABQ8S3Z6_PERAM|nr:hypothetical protein ANN_25734 [Periplaneta americana]
MLAGNEFQSLGRAIVKEDEYEEVRWDGIVSIVSWRERVFRLWWEESEWLFLCQGQRLKPEWEKDLPPATKTVMSAKGYMTTAIFIYCLGQFSRYKVAGEVVLIFDGASSNLDTNIGSATDNYRITLYCLPSNITHELQPMDKVHALVGCVLYVKKVVLRTSRYVHIVREVEKFKYLGATVTNINDTREEIKYRINMGNACYYSVEKLLSSSLLMYQLVPSATGWMDGIAPFPHRYNNTDDSAVKNLKVRIYKTVILPVVLYGSETWILTLREEHRLRVFENKVLRKIFGAKRDEVTGEWRKLHNAELHALYSSPDIIRNIKSRRLKWAGHVARMGESRNAYSVLVGRPEEKRHLGRSRRRWEDNIKMDFREVGYDDRDWINLAQCRDRRRAYVRAAMNLRIL